MADAGVVSRARWTPGTDDLAALGRALGARARARPSARGAAPPTGSGARPPCSSSRTTRTIWWRWPAASGRPATVPVLVLGQGLQPAGGRRAASPAGRLPRGRLRRRCRSTGHHGAGRGGASASRCWPAGPRPPGSRGLEWAVGVPGSVGGAVADERRGPRVGHRRHPGRLPVGRPDHGRRCRVSRPERLAFGYRHTGAGRHRGGGGRRPSRSSPATRDRGQGDHRRDRALAAGQPARGQQRRVGVHQPAGRLGRAADRRLRVEGPPDRHAPRCRPSTPTSSRPTRAARPTTCAGSSTTCRRRWPPPPASTLRTEVRMVGFPTTAGPGAPDDAVPDPTDGRRRARRSTPGSASAGWPSRAAGAAVGCGGWPAAPGLGGGRGGGGGSLLHTAVVRAPGWSP